MQHRDPDVSLESHPASGSGQALAGERGMRRTGWSNEMRRLDPDPRPAARSKAGSCNP